MSGLRTIEIDFDVHRAIEMERMGFDEAPNSALRRLLKLGSATTTSEVAPSTGRAWAGKGVTLPHGTQIKMEYNGRPYTGRIEDGEWWVEGKRFKSPSAAAGGVAVTRAGKKTSLDGWIYWQVKRPSDTRWYPLSHLKG
ncbi:hypothetical protein [Mesorhizobium sp.]|uniref:hypothetical protein n=1 Tax=Mesorhizobium sp. TaxID=1871066 RepID=UPI000FE6A819|nr:hypothetical protein [Mesorhizobium sp.]RWB02100.1 MAG: hypothetical protein EOQ33_16540 [Mesorhizobium sp.]